MLKEVLRRLEEPYIDNLLHEKEKACKGHILSASLCSVSEVVVRNALPAYMRCESWTIFFILCVCQIAWLVIDIHGQFAKNARGHVQ